MPKHKKLVALGCVVGLAGVILAGFQLLDSWLPHFRVVRRQMLYRSGQPRGPGLPLVRALGVRTLVNLRAPESDGTPEERTYAESHGMAFRNIHVGESAEEIAEAVAEFREILDDPDSYPILVHCSRGKERAGVFSAVYRIAYEDWANERALYEAQSLGLDPGSMPVAEAFIWGYGRSPESPSDPSGETAPAESTVPWKE